MTIQQLIDKLMEIQDKDQYARNAEYGYLISQVHEGSDGVYIS